MPGPGEIDRNIYGPTGDPFSPTAPPEPVGPGDVGGVRVGPLEVPANIYGIVRAAAIKYQVPEDVILAVLYQESRFNPVARNDNTRSGGVGVDRGIAQINSYYYAHVTDAMADDPNFAIDLLAKETAQTFARMGGSSLSSGTGAWRAKWFDAATNWHRKTQDTHWFAYRAALEGHVQAGTTLGPDRDLRPLKSSRTTIEGFDEDASDALHQVADALFIKYLGRNPTLAEYQDIHRRGWNKLVLEDWLRRQGVPGTTTNIGTLYDARVEAGNQAQKVLGRDATEEEINWIIVNRIPLTHISAYYEQIRDKAPWAADPDTYRNNRDRVHQMLSRFGVTIAKENVSVDLVNSTLGKSDDEVEQAIRKMQMPGMPVGVTIGQAASARDVAEAAYKTYFPGQSLTPELLAQMIGMSPDQIMAFIRGLPSLESPGIQAGAYQDAKNTAADVLNRLGFIGRTPKPNEVAAIATNRLDLEGVVAYYSNLPELVRQQPGLPYGKSREDYYRDRLTVEGTYASLFGKEITPGLAQAGSEPNLHGVSAATSPAARDDNATGVNYQPGHQAPPEPDWLKALFKEGISADDARRNFASHFRNLGRPPSTDEVKSFKSRVAMMLGGDIVQPGGGASALGPVASTLGGPSRRRVSPYARSA